MSNHSSLKTKIYTMVGLGIKKFCCFLSQGKLHGHLQNTSIKEERQKNYVLRKARAKTRLLRTVQKFGFINGVDNVNWPPYRDSKALALRQSESRDYGLRVVFIVE